MSKPKSAGYFRNGMPYNRLGHGPRPLIVFQGLMFENKPQPRMAFGMYRFLEDDYTGIRCCANRACRAATP